MHGRCGVAVLAMAAALACGFWPFRTTTITPLHKTNWSHQEALASSSLPHSVSNWSAWMDTSPETETTSDSASTSSGFPPEAAADSTVTRSATTSDALVTTSVLVTTSKAPVTSSKAPVTSFTGSSIVPASTSHDLAVAVAIVGGARSLLWNAVCKNIKERLVNGLAADGWRVDVFLFLSLRDDARPGRVARNYRPEQMAYCQKLLMPVHSEWMESVYVPPPHGCAKGQEPGYTRKVKKKEKDRAASLRVFSQCKRLEIAYDFIETYEQTDTVYLETAPPISSFNLSKFTVSAGAYGDHWHVVHRGCRMVSPKCIRCQDAFNDTTCFSYGLKSFDSRIHAVLAREEERSYFAKRRIKLPPGQRSQSTFLRLECDRWLERLRTFGRQTLDWNICEREAFGFLQALPPERLPLRNQTENADRPRHRFLPHVRACI
ncbi:unnamed protein product [Durusdinium trenchii]|uniref:Uncharacterized protein n=1 Tax=Durusdinium trenchii TaxID=1381693 RepID=A0ABP0N1D6_9DINO